MNVRQRLGLFLACIVAVFPIVLFRFFKASSRGSGGPGPLLRGGLAPPTALDSFSRIQQQQQQQQQQQEQHRRIAGAADERRGGNRDARIPRFSGRNDECQWLVDDRGNPPSLDAGPILTMEKAGSGDVSDGGYAYYTVCISQHRHHHRVDLTLTVHKGEADMYVSASEPYPRMESGSMWISATQGDEHLSLPTYADDFSDMRSIALFVGVHGRPSGKFSLELAITDVGERELAAHMSLGYGLHE